MKWARRRPAAAALIAVSAAALLTVLIGGGWYNARLKQANHESAVNLEASQRNLGVANGAVNRMLERVADDLAPIPHTEAIRQRLLDDALAFYRATVRHAVDNADGRVLLAGAYVKIGDIHRLLGATADAEKAYRQAIETAEPLMFQVPADSEYVVTLAGAHNNFGNLLASLGATWMPSRTTVRHWTSCGRCSIAATRRSASKPAACTTISASCSPAKKSCRRPRRRIRRPWPCGRNCWSNFPAMPIMPSTWRSATTIWARCICGRSVAAPAAEAFENADRLFQGIPAGSLLPAQRTAWAKLRSNLGAIRQQQDRGTEAEEAFRRAVKAQAALAADFPAVAAYRDDLAGMYFNLGRQLVGNNKMPAGREAFQQALRLYEALAAESPGDKRLAGEVAQCRKVLTLFGPQ